MSAYRGRHRKHRIGDHRKFTPWPRFTWPVVMVATMALTFLAGGYIGH